MTGSRRHGSLIGLDVGTTGARAVAIDLDGRVLCTATAGCREAGMNAMPTELSPCAT